MAAKKRSLDICDLSSVTSPCKCAKVEGILLQVSPMKGTYFDGRMADDSGASIRIVGFDKRKQQELSAMYDKEQAIVLDNCELKESKVSGQIEVMLNNSTRVSSSVKNFKIKSNALISLDAIDTLPEHAVVSVKVKVIKRAESVKVKFDLVKQDVIVADTSGCAKLVLWQSDVDKLNIGESYICSGLTVRTFDGSKFLTPPKSGWTFSSCDDVEVNDIHNEYDEFEIAKNEESIVTNAYIAGVMNLEVKISCLSCKSSVEPINSNIGKCSRCSMTQIIKNCNRSLSAKLFVNTEDSQNSYTCYASLGIIRDITQDDEINEDSTMEEVMMKILQAENFHLTHQNGIIVAINRN